MDLEDLRAFRQEMVDARERHAVTGAARGARHVQARGRAPLISLVSALAGAATAVAILRAGSGPPGPPGPHIIAARPGPSLADASTIRDLRDRLTAQLAASQRLSGDRRALSKKVDDLSRRLARAQGISRESPGGLVSPADQAVIARAERTGKVPIQIASAEVSWPRSRGDARSYGPVTPNGGVILSNQPTLKWNPLDKAGSYRVEVHDAAGKLAASTRHGISKTEWQTPPLARDETYSWEAIPLGPQGELTRFRWKSLPRFRTPSAARSAVYVKAELQLAILKSRDGMIREALDLFNDILANDTHSESARLARKFRAAIAARIDAARNSPSAR